MSKPIKARPKVMTLTDAAAERICDLLADRDGVVGLRIGIKKGGCAGMEYTMGWADEVGKFEEVIEDKGATVIIEPTAVMYLLGTQMDYSVDKLSSGFVFNNPNQVSACGCGESISLVPAADAMPAEAT
ncbi:MAG: iron-sulfur cluster assembly accessory protein [Pseudomonadota bacterium]